MSKQRIKTAWCTIQEGKVLALSCYYPKGFPSTSKTVEIPEVVTMDTGSFIWKKAFKLLVGFAVQGCRIHLPKLGIEYQATKTHKMRCYSFVDFVYNVESNHPTMLEHLYHGHTIQEWMTTHREAYDPRRPIGPVLWNAIDDYNKAMIRRINEKNNNYEVFDTVYKDLLHLMWGKIQINGLDRERNFIEVAEYYQYQKELASLQADPIPEQERVWLDYYRKFYDVECHPIGVFTNWEKTRQGFAQHEQITYYTNENLYYNKQYGAQGMGLPLFMRKDAAVHWTENMTELRQAYKMVKIFQRNEDKYLGLDYKLCPVCGKPYHVEQGCLPLDYEITTEDESQWEWHVLPAKLDAVLSWKTEVKDTWTKDKLDFFVSQAMSEYPELKKLIKQRMHRFHLSSIPVVCSRQKEQPETPERHSTWLDKMLLK